MHDVPSIIERLGRKTIQMALKGETAEKRANAVQKIGREIRDLDLSEADRVLRRKFLTGFARMFLIWFVEPYQ